MLTTASFARKFCDIDKFKPDDYVSVVKDSIVLTKMRNSKVFSRAITSKQLKQMKPEHMLCLLLKYQDYKLAIVMTDLNDKLKRDHAKRLSQIY